MVDGKYSHMAIWLIWEAVLDAAKHSPQSGTLAPYIDAVYKAHCSRWSPTAMKQRIPFLITAIMFICESTTIDIHYSVPHDIIQVHKLIENIPSWISAIVQTQKTFSS